MKLKYQSVTPSGSKDIGIRKFEFVLKIFVPLTQTLFSTYLESLGNH